MGAEWHTDGAAITMYTWPRQSKSLIILNFIHELGHHLDWVYSGRKMSEAETNAHIMEYSRQKKDPVLKKSIRKKIYDSEVRGMNYREAIWNEVNIKLPKWMLMADIDLDEWIYRRYYETGVFPLQKEITDMKKNFKSLRKKEWEIAQEER